MTQRLRILTVCGVGQGSSLVLRMYVEDVVKEIGVKAEVQVADVATAKSTPCDLILTASHLMPHLESSAVPVRAVKSFVNKAEIRQILEEFLRGRN